MFFTLLNQINSTSVIIIFSLFLCSCWSVVKNCKSIWYKICFWDWTCLWSDNNVTSSVTKTNQSINYSDLEAASSPRAGGGGAGPGWLPSWLWRRGLTGCRIEVNKRRTFQNVSYTYCMSEEFLYIMGVIHNKVESWSEGTCEMCFIFNANPSVLICFYFNI